MRPFLTAALMTVSANATEQNDQDRRRAASDLFGQTVARHPGAVKTTLQQGIIEAEHKSYTRDIGHWCAVKSSETASYSLDRTAALLPDCLER